MHIGYVSERRSDFRAMGWSEEEAAEFNTDSTIDAVMAAIASLGHTVEFVGDFKSLARRLVCAEPPVGHRKQKLPWDLIYNDSEGVYGNARESQVPALCEAWGMPFTHSDAACFAVCFDKGLTKMVLEHNGIATAPWVAVPNPVELTQKTTSGDNQVKCQGNGVRDLTPNCPKPPGRALSAILSSQKHSQALQSFPLFVKPTCEGTSKGVYRFSKVHNISELEDSVSRIAEKFPGQDILIESFLSGRELTISLAGTGSDSRVIGMWEMSWLPGRPDFYSVDEKTNYDVPLSELTNEWFPDENDPQVILACELALKTWRVMKCRDMGRVDIRFEGDMPYVLEVNPIAGMVEGLSCLPEGSKPMGYEYRDLFGLAIESACKRYGLDPEAM